MKIKTMAEAFAAGENAEILFWVGCAGSFDERAQRITRSLAALLEHAGISFAVLGTEESCTGDPAKRAGNEFLFQMMALANIEVLNGYEVKKIVTACPHCFNTLKNEYPGLGGKYEVIHHSQLLSELLEKGLLRLSGENAPQDSGAITFHDPCYLGRANGEYEAPRMLLGALQADLREMKRSRSGGLCCGAGGAQVFKEPEPGKKDIQLERAQEALGTGAKVIATACPFCMLMLRDGLRQAGKEEEAEVLDLAELLARGLQEPRPGSGGERKPS